MSSKLKPCPFCGADALEQCCWLGNPEGFIAIQQAEAHVIAAAEAYIDAPSIKHTTWVALRDAVAALRKAREGQ